MSPFSLSTPATYRITIQGRLSRSWSECFGNMTIGYHLAADGSRLSVLTGRLTDQAALFGVLNGLYGLGLPLISVECLDSGPAA
ncbi:MAG: hypothetical protein KDI79_15655 [Anaerolineae bacterium]|nr:hypothetical protein [Anaerolineae bacterium]